MNIYVGNLAYEVTDDNLAEEFGAYGQVESARVITDRFSGRSRGFGFVEMPNDAEAQTAIDSISGKEIKGRAVTANQARPRESMGGGGGGGRGAPRW